MMTKVAKADELHDGGLMLVNASGREVVLGRSGDKFFAVDRRCGHMNAPLEFGTLKGQILTCPMHSAQFDMTTGMVLIESVPAPPHRARADTSMDAVPKYIDFLMNHVETRDIKAYPVKVENGEVWIDF
jgi:nitrite reductase/ring-hydroxylating ferredoxin subunit